MASSDTLAALPATGHSHTCSVFDGEEAFRLAAVEFLREGVSREERLVYVADQPAQRLRDDLREFDQLFDEGTLVVRPAGDLYGGPDGVDASSQTETYRRAVAQAVDDGYSGLRVAADASALVPTPAHRRRMLRYELDVDHLMAQVPMVALCGYDRTRLGDAALEFCTVHPESVSLSGGVTLPTFHFSDDGDRVRLAGEVDLAARSYFSEVLDAVVATADTELTLDLHELAFIDAAGLWQLNHLVDELHAAGRRVRIEGPSPTVDRSCEVLRFDGLQATMVQPGEGS